MTERSWLWDGNSTGDASLAPYAKDAFNRWFASPQSLNSSDRVYILPGYLNDLQVEPIHGTAYSTVAVQTGVAIFNNYIYYNTEPLYISITPLSTENYYRFDRLVLRLDRSSQTIKAALLTGVESSTYPPALPDLTQSTTGIYEIEIARVLVDSTTFLVDHDHLQLFQRYLPIGPLYTNSPFNLFINSEFMAIDNGNAQRASSWTSEVNVGDLGTLSRGSPIAPQKRGYSWTFTGTSNATNIFQWVPLTNLVQDGSNVLSYEGLFSLANSTTRVQVLFEFYDDTTTKITGADVSIYLRDEGVNHVYKTFNIPSGAATVKVYLKFISSTVSFSVGQQLLSLGYFTGGFRTFHEPLYYLQSLTDTSWDGDAKSTGTTTIDLSSSFGAAVPRGTRAVILNIYARDSGSGTGGPRVDIYSYTGSAIAGSLNLNGVRNDNFRGAQVVAYISEPLHTSGATTRGFRVAVTATGASTCDVWLNIIGIIT